MVNIKIKNQNCECIRTLNNDMKNISTEKINGIINDISNKKVSEIKSLVEGIEESYYEEVCKILSQDERKSVQNISNKLNRIIEKNKAEDERLEKINMYENNLRSQGYKFIGGVDEVGRGPLAGPVVAAIVIFDENTKIRGIDDSKKLSAEKREELFEIIKEKAVDYAIGIADNKEIDEYNILNATYLAMKRAIENLKIKPDTILNDAVTIPGIECNQVLIIKGDSKSISIAAASIIAKVTRDRMMVEYDNEYGGYGFASNKGYGTTEHYDGLRKYGKTKIHRDSFLKNFK